MILFWLFLTNRSHRSRIVGARRNTAAGSQHKALRYRKGTRGTRKLIAEEILFLQRVEDKNTAIER
jgi:hypothetical protein